MRGQISEIISRELHKKHDKEGWIVTAIVEGEEVSGYTTDKNEYQVGDKVTFYFDDRYQKPKMSLDTSYPL